MFRNKLYVLQNIASRYDTKRLCLCSVFSKNQSINKLNKHKLANKQLIRHHSQITLPEDTSKSNVNSDLNSYSYRTHTCGELRDCDVGKQVVVCGWVQFLRLSKFLLLRDSYGMIQCVCGDSKVDFSNIPLEAVVKIEGTVVQRPKDMVNKQMSTGNVEIMIKDLQILNTVENLPFNLRDYQKPKEQLRLQHRYLDLRFPEMQYNLRQRSLLLHNMRRFLVENKGFTEVETPTLFCCTPGGAREFVVPTRHSQLFYSLVQSPQQFKQMLMVGGVDRYFQIARCYRDETTRPDRQPEFTQLDIELSFTNRDGIMTMIEDLLYNCYLQPISKPPFKRITYQYAFENYGTDKPDLSIGLQFKNITKLFPEKNNDENFSAFLLPYPVEVDKFTAKTKEIIKSISKKYTNTKIILNDNLQKALGEELSKTIKEYSGNENNAVIAIGERNDSCLSLGEIRNVITSLLKSKNILKINNSIMEPIWVTDFPLFLKDVNGKIETCHHPFTAPHPDDINLLDTQPYLVRSLAYDLVMNGNEIGGGSVRVHNSNLQEKLLKILNIDSTKLNHFMNALRSGCPPHAGIALGIDRLIAVMCNAESIRDVIAFPKSHEGKDPLSGAPNFITDEEKQYYHIKTVD